MPRYGTIDRDYGIRLATCDPDADGPIYMLNLMKYREEADYGASDQARVSGREADDRYAPIDVFDAIGASVCFFADVVEASEDWDRVAVARYPSRRTFIEMQSRPDFQEQHIHKEAGMDHTVVMGTTPTQGLPGRAKPSRVLLEVWGDGRPPTIGDDRTVSFEVEGTIIGDGRRWSGARYTVLDDDARADLTGGSSTYQMLLLQPVIERWT